MRPIDSSYDRMMAAAASRAESALDPDVATAGDHLDYDAATEIDDAGWSHLRQRLAQRGLELRDDGSGYVVAGGGAR